MDWLNIHRSVTDSPEFIGCEPLDRATWLCLLAYCAGQENGGLIQACADWSDRKWQQLARIMLREVKRECDLWSWQGSDLIVRFYPQEKEREIRAKRAAGKERAAQRWSTPLAQPDKATLSLDSSPDSSAISSAQKELDAEGKGREGKGIGRKEYKAASAAGSPALLIDSLTLPDVLNTLDFLAAWDDWIAYRRERKLPTYKPRALAAQLSTLAEWGTVAAIASVRESIRQQWQGLFPPKAGPGTHLTSGPVPWQRKTHEIDHNQGF